MRLGAPLAGNVVVTGGANWPAPAAPGDPPIQPIAAPGDAITWFISFTGALANTGRASVPPLNQIGMVNAAAPNALVGGAVRAGNTRRGGANTNYRASSLVSDFDNGLNQSLALANRYQNDALGLGYNIPPNGDLGVVQANEIQTVTLGPAAPNSTFTLKFTPTPSSAGAPPRHHPLYR